MVVPRVVHHEGLDTRHSTRNTSVRLRIQTFSSNQKKRNAYPRDYNPAIPLFVVVISREKTGAGAARVYFCGFGIK